MHGRLPIRLTLLAPVSVSLFLAACGGGGGGPFEPPVRPVAVFESEGLAGGTIHQLRRSGDKLFAATDDGLFQKTVGDNRWQLVGLDDINVLAFVAIAADHWLAAGFERSDVTLEHPKLLETVNAGSNWLEISHDFGAGGTRTEPIYALAYDPNGGVLYATGTAALARSTDFGRHWDVIDGTVDSAGSLSALGLQPATGQVWFGGQNAIEQMVLRRYDVGSGQTQSFPAMLPSPSVIKGLTFDPADAERVLASGEGGILQTRDGGTTWINLLGDVDHRFYFNAVLDPADSEVIYTVGWTKTPDRQPLILEVSRDGGATWTEHQHADASIFGGAWSVMAVREGTTTAIYAGLDGGGIYRITFR